MYIKKIMSKSAIPKRSLSLEIDLGRSHRPSGESVVASDRRQGYINAWPSCDIGPRKDFQFPWMWRDFDRFPRLSCNPVGMAPNNLPVWSDIAPRRRLKERENAWVEWCVLPGAGPWWPGWCYPLPGEESKWFLRDGDPQGIWGKTPVENAVFPRPSH